MNTLCKLGLTTTLVGAVFGASLSAQCPQVDTLLPGGLAPGAAYGRSVAIDGNVAVIGAESDTTISGQEGAAYVWRHDGVQWNQETKLAAFDGAGFDQFGNQVEISGNVIAVSAPKDDDLGSQSGSVYIYRYDGTNWVFEVKLTRSAGGANDGWGENIALDGDVLAVASVTRSLVDIYRDQGGFLGWQLEGTLTSDLFYGEAVDVEGNTLLIGDASETFQGFGSGVVYVYDFDGSLWNLTQTLSPANPVGSESFGSSVSINGPQVAVGAEMPSSTGSVFVFELIGGTWTETANLVPAGFPGGSRFGHAVAMGDDTLIAADEFTGLPYEFRKVRGAWVEATAYTAGSGAQRLGIDLAISGSQAIMGSTNDLAFEFNAGSLQMTVSPALANAGDLVTLDTFCGPPNNLVGMFVVGANGINLFETLLLFRFASDYHLTAAGSAPSGLSGLQLDLMSIGIGPGGLAIASNVASLSFQ